MAALMSSIPGKKKIMKEAAVPPTMCRTAPKSDTCTPTVTLPLAYELLKWIDNANVPTVSVQSWKARPLHF